MLNQINPLKWKTILPVREIQSPPTLLHILGKGGFGTVYAGELPVAIKEINLKKNVDEQRLQQEVTALYMVKNCHAFPNLFDVLFDSKDVRLFLIMERLSGTNLRDFLKKNGPQSEKVTAEIIRQLSKGLICLHSHNLSHRDIKLENSMYDPDTKVAKWVDLGLVCIDMCNAQTVGTPSTMAPEVVARTVQPNMWNATDIWSFGCMIYELCHGDGNKLSFQMKIVVNYYHMIQKDSRYRQQMISEIDRYEKKNIKNTALRIQSDNLFFTNYPKLSAFTQLLLIINPKERWEHWQKIISKLRMTTPVNIITAPKDSPISLTTPTTRPNEDHLFVQDNQEKVFPQINAPPKDTLVQQKNVVLITPTDIHIQQKDVPRLTTTPVINTLPTMPPQKNQSEAIKTPTSYHEVETFTKDQLLQLCKQNPKTFRGYSALKVNDLRKFYCERAGLKLE